jgi:5-methylcytosine-specific restriction endonuclease McrA
MTAYTNLPRACISGVGPCSDGGIAVRGQSRCRNHMPKHGWGRYALKHPERAAFYASAHWRERRARHLFSNPFCVVCGGKGTHVDHVINLASGGRLDGPVQSLCAEHHKAKTQEESKQGNKRAAARRRKEGGSNVRRIH